MDGDTIAVSCLVGVDVAELLKIKQCMIRSEAAIFHCLVTNFNCPGNAALVCSPIHQLKCLNFKHTTSRTNHKHGMVQSDVREPGPVEAQVRHVSPWQPVGL